MTVAPAIAITRARPAGSARQLLRDTAWPAQVREPMAVLAAVEHSGAKQAGEVRAALGLPPYPQS